MPYLPTCLPTAVGSLPLTNPQAGADLILDYLPRIPTWPQLPNAWYLESMYLQYSGGMPFVRLDAVNKRMYMDLSGDIYTELERFYERVLADDLDYFALSREHASGFWTLLDRLWRHKPLNLDHLKGQITGPISFGLMITDERKRAILYHEEVFDTVVKSLALKARWQIRILKMVWPHIIIFIDEPYLSSFGSAFININREQVLSYLGEVVEAIHQEGALVGVHCCGNTDWSILMESHVDIINFDAYEYFQGMTLYIEQLQGFLYRNGVLAWGIIPTSPQSQTPTPEELRGSFLEKVDALASRGLDKQQLLKQALLTPSCGMGMLSEDRAERVLQTLADVSRQVRLEFLEQKNSG
jgi:methionine synthase II (cobalamin-independent)